VSRSKPALVHLSELTPGQQADFFALLAERTRGKTRDGKPFYSCRFRDNQRSVTFMVWADGGWFETCEKEWREGQLYKIRGDYGEHERYGPQINLHNIRPVNDSDRADGFNPGDFVERTRHDPAAMFARLVSLAREKISDPPLRRLVVTLLERHATAFQSLPATRHHGYPYYGGLLEHTLSVAETSLWLADKYAAHFPTLNPPLNHDLVIAGAILHDLGRVLEFDHQPVNVERTVAGKLIGPILLARDLVRDTARELGDIHPERLQLLEHLLVSHLNLLERDSPRQPMIPECLIVHHADALDSFLEMYVRCLNQDEEPGAFTGKGWCLGRELFKGRQV
jgi:3'-5' exoribonuclease